MTVELEEAKHALHEHKELEDEKRRVMKRRMGLEAMLKTLVQYMLIMIITILFPSREDS